MSQFKNISSRKTLNFDSVLTIMVDMKFELRQWRVELLNDAVSDTTDDDSSNAVWSKTFISYKNYILL